MLFDLTDLRLFILVAELKSLTRAAERMHLSLGAILALGAGAYLAQLKGT